MPTIQVEAQVSSSELLRAVEQLDAVELERFVLQVIALKAGRSGPQLSRTEAELLTIINQPLPAALGQRYAELLAKRSAEMLSPNEHAELLRLTDQVEKLEANRLEALVELAHLRKTSLTALMKDLDIRVPTDG